MRLAFIDNLPVGGGLSRFSLLLCRNLIENYPSLVVDYFIHSDNLKHIPEIKSIDRVKVIVLASTCPANLATRVVQKVKTIVGASNQHPDRTIAEIESLVDRKYDIAYFPSAHMMRRPNISIPVVGTLHDFNWKYFFGRQIFSSSFVKMMDVEILKWMNLGLNICSSHDVVSEARKLYPAAGKFPRVVHIGPVVVNNETSEARAEELLKQLNIDFPYIIFPGNFFPHKNHLNLFTAFSLLKKRSGFASYKLLLTGLNSEQVRKGVAEYRGVRLLTENDDSSDFDVVGMGYQPNEVIDVLIKKARLLVSPSIYEAICTPGMDAWNFGTPTAISDIPPFREHEKVWNIRSAFFDPMNPENIADVIEQYLSDYEVAKEDGRVSRINMASYSWKQVAAGYMEVFKDSMSSL
jgi:glycosyltransferase involved in cell wall biosynthesis